MISNLEEALYLGHTWDKEKLKSGDSIRCKVCGYKLMYYEMTGGVSIMVERQDYTIGDELKYRKCAEVLMEEALE